MNFKKIPFLFLAVLVITLLVSGCTITIGNPSGGRASDGGIWQSTDRGQHWTQKVKFPLPKGKIGNISNAGIRRIVFDPKDAKTIYLATDNNGLVYTNNSGDSWQQFSQLTQGRVRAVAISHDSQCVLYAVADNKLFKSSNCGQTWDNPYFHQNTQTVLTDVDIDPLHPATIFLTTAAGEILKSINAGSTWQAVFNTNGVFADLFINPKNSNVIYAATVKNGIFKSADAGKTWVSLSGNLKSFKNSQNYRLLIMNPVNPENLILVSYDNMFNTNDGGQTWTALNLISDAKSAIIYAAAVNPKNSSEIYYATATTFLKSTDGGKTWFSLRLPFTKIPNRLVINPINPSILYLGTVNP